MSRNEKAPLKDETFRSAFSCVFCYKYSKSRDGVKQFVDKGSWKVLLEEIKGV